MTQHVEHVVDCGARGTNHIAVDQDATAGRLAEFTLPGELSFAHAEERDRRQRAALERLQMASLTDEHLRDILIVLGVEEQ
jgi:hypothetical protein